MHPGRLTFALALLAACRPDGTAPRTQTPSAADPHGLARRVVAHSARLRHGDLVLITGGAEDITLLKDLAIEAGNVGAGALVSITDPNAVSGTEKLSGLVTAEIFVESAPGKGAAGQVGARRVSLGNGLYPTEERARTFGMTREALSEVFWGGLNVDYDALQAAGADLRRRFAQGHEVRLIHRNGTDLRMRIESQAVAVNDGVISEEDARAGGPASAVRLPAGEVLVRPVKGSASGIVVGDQCLSGSRTATNLRLEFSRGRAIEAGTTRWQELRLLDVGINPKVTNPSTSRLAARMPAGSVTLLLGAGDSAGYDETARSGPALCLAEATLLVDGVPLVRDGRLAEPPDAPSLGRTRAAPESAVTYLRSSP
jgi:hypothetical protein